MADSISLKPAFVKFSKQIEIIRDETEKILLPMRLVNVVIENGEVWYIRLSAFIQDEGFILNLFEKEKDKFTRVETQSK